MDISKYPCIILSVRYPTNKRAIDAKQVPTAKVVVVIVTQEDHQLADINTRKLSYFYVCLDKIFLSSGNRCKRLYYICKKNQLFRSALVPIVVDISITQVIDVHFRE